MKVEKIIIVLQTPLGMTMTFVGLILSVHTQNLDLVWLVQEKPISFNKWVFWITTNPRNNSQLIFVFDIKLPSGNIGLNLDGYSFKNLNIF